MIRLIKCEYKKTKRKHLFFTAFAALVLMSVWAFYGDMSSDFIRRNGYSMFLYQFPLVNAIFFPLLCTVIASRLCDLEHKGSNFKLLCTMEDKGKLFDAKLLYGLMIVLSGVQFNAISVMNSSSPMKRGERSILNFDPRCFCSLMPPRCAFCVPECF